MKNKKTIILLLLIAIVGVVGLTLAYFANTANVENEFKTKQYGTTVTEVFESPSDWTPGTDTPKTLTVTNSGQVDEAVRVSYTESWTSKNSNLEGNLELSQGNNRAAIINFSDNGDWTLVTESDNKTYYYYNYKLAPGEKTSTLLDSVTFNKDIVNANNCVETKTATGKKVECISDGAGYDGATYKLVFKVETVQYDQYKNAWGTGAVISNSSKPAPVVAQTGVQKLLSTATNTSTITSYNDENADKGKMFVFNHEETEQTDALTDYRYIGDSPNNFVYFNCTNDNDTDTCEVWRIIGVFSVERTDPNDSSKTITEQRIKIIKGNLLSEEMAWDTNNVNEWSNASLKIYLNGTYFDNLSEISKLQIEDAKYYLGGKKWDDTTFYGSIEAIYTWERGTETCVTNGTCSGETKSTSWEGKVGLMYPSDMYMIYSQGVDIVCYNDPYNCSEYSSWGYHKATNIGYPTMGWIHNTNKLQNSDTQKTTWLLNHNTDGSYGTFYASFNGGMNTNNTTITVGVRPVVYLKSSIQITGGDGSEQHPYELSGN